jgi:hypothetical protein
VVKDATAKWGFHQQGGGESVGWDDEDKQLSFPSPSFLAKAALSFSQPVANLLLNGRSKSDGYWMLSLLPISFPNL